MYAVLATIEQLENCAYRVSSQSKPGECYTVQTIQLNCTCQLKCNFCYACAHMYSCTCLDACTNTTVCKHMHLVQMKTKPKGVTHTRSQADELDYFSRVATSIPISVTRSGTKLKREWLIFSIFVMIAMTPISYKGRITSWGQCWSNFSIILITTPVGKGSLPI